jgi:hemin uptake protein HemP
MVAMTERQWPSTQDKNDGGAIERPGVERPGMERPAAERSIGQRSPNDTPRRVPLSRILGSDREIVIEFNGADYKLRITRNHKLILTK